MGRDLNLSPVEQQMFSTGEKLLNKDASVSLFKYCSSNGIIKWRSINATSNRKGEDMFKTLHWERKPMEYKDNIRVTHNINLECQLIIKGLKEGKSILNIIKGIKDKVLKQEFIIFLLKIETWEKYLDSHNLSPFMSPIELIVRNLEDKSKFAQSVKKSIDYTIRVTTCYQEVIVPDGVITYPNLKDINQIFPPRHMIPFLFEEDLEDAEYSLQETPCKVENLEDLKDILRKNIKDDVNLRQFDTLDAITLANEKKCLHKGKSVKSFHAREQNGFPRDLSNSSLEFLVKHTTKSAEEERVILLSDIPTRNLIYIVRKQTEQLHNAKYDVYGKNRWLFYKILKTSPSKVFMLADQKKFGPTFPRYLLVLYFEVLIEKYPNYHNFKIIRDMYLNNEIYFTFEGKGRMQTKRGFILGMFDNIAGFILSCIFELFLFKISERTSKFEGKVQAHFWGDDQIIALDDIPKPEILKFWNTWLFCQESYGMIINRPKSFLSTRGVFCEMYSPDIPDYIILEKRAVYFLTPFNSLRGVNKPHCKSLWSTFNDYLGQTIPWYDHISGNSIEEFCKDSLNRSQKIIGYEFDETEYNLPYQLGGWIFPRDLDGRPNLFDVMDENKFPIPFLRVGLVKQSKPHLNNKSKQKLTDIMDTHWIRDLMCMFDLRLGKHFLSDLYERQIEDHIRLSLPVLHKNMQWFKFEKQRMDAYQNNNRHVYLQEIIRFLFWEGEYKNNRPKLEYFIKNKTDPLSFGCFSITTKKFKSIDPFRAILLIHKNYLDNKTVDVAYEREQDFSLVDLTCSIFPDLAKLGWSVPLKWYVWLKSQDTNIKEFWDYYHKMYDGINIFDYEPPFLIRKEEISWLNGDYDLNKNPHIFWDPWLGRPLITDTDYMIKMCTNDVIDKNFIRNIDLISDLEFEYKYAVRNNKDGYSPPESDEDYIIPDNDTAINEYIGDLNAPIALEPEVQEEKFFLDFSDGDNEFKPDSDYFQSDDDLRSFGCESNYDIFLSDDEGCDLRGFFDVFSETAPNTGYK